MINLNQKESTTRTNILEAGQKEFMNKGFRAASLRNIVKEAGVTTGAFYGYFTSKEDLFSALVAEPAKVFYSKFEETQNKFAQLPPEQQECEMGKLSGDCMEWMVEYIYQHFAAFKLILCSAEGTAYENFVHAMVEIEVEATHRFMYVLSSMEHQVPAIDRQLEHILVSGFFSAFFEIVIHDMPKQQAIGYIKELRAFHTAGWQKIMGL